jgi:hypothetical protein
VKLLEHFHLLSFPSQVARLGGWMRQRARVGQLKIIEAGLSPYRNHFTNIKIRRMPEQQRAVVRIELGGFDFFVSVIAAESKANCKL